MNLRSSQTKHLNKQELILVGPSSGLIWLFCLLFLGFLISSCSTTEPINQTDQANNQESSTPDSLSAIDATPSIAGFIELIQVDTSQDTTRTRLSGAALTIRDLEGLPLSETETNFRGEFFIELDAFKSEEQYDMFIYSSVDDIMRNIRFIYTDQESDSIKITLDRNNRTEMNIDYLDLITGEGKGEIITNE